MKKQPQTTSHYCDKTTDIELIKQHLEYIKVELSSNKEVLTDIQHKLIGNGKPGVLSDIKGLQTIAEEYKETKKTVDAIDKKIYYAMGVIAVIVLLLTMFVPKIVAALIT